METKTLVCPYCRQTKLLVKDSHTKMWEMAVGFGAISNTYWKYLENTWLDIHAARCESRHVQIGAGEMRN